VDPRAGLDDVKMRKFFSLPELEVRPLGRPARSQSLYRLSYPGSLTITLSTVDLSVAVNETRREFCELTL
jgi:hypothetical protein